MGRWAVGSRQTRDSFTPALSSPAADLGFFTDFVEVALLEVHLFPPTIHCREQLGVRGGGRQSPASLERQVSVTIPPPTLTSGPPWASH